MASRPFVHHVYGPFSRHSPLEERQKSIIFKQGLFTTFAFLAMTDNFLSISSLHSLKKSPWSFTHSATSAIISFKYVNGGGGAKARVFKLYLHIFVLFWQLSLSPPLAPYVTVNGANRVWTDGRVDGWEDGYKCHVVKGLQQQHQPSHFALPFPIPNSGTYRIRSNLQTE